MKNNLIKSVGLFSTLLGFILCFNMSSYAYSYMSSDMDFSEIPSVGNWDESVTLTTHGYEYDTINNKIYLSDIKIDGFMVVPSCEIVILNDVLVNTIETYNNYDSNFDLKISGSGDLIAYNFMIGCGDLELDGSDGLEVSVNHVNNHNTGGTGLFKITDMNDCIIRGISWTALDGLKVIDSNIELGTDNYVFVETIDMDVDSVINLKSDIGNYGNTSDGLDSLIDMIPSGYSIKYNQNILNSLYDADDNLVTNLILKYRPSFNINLSSSPDDIGILSSSLTSAKDGDVIKLTATSSNAEYDFDFWECNGVKISDLNNYDYNLIEPDADLNIKAVFKYIYNISTDSNASISGGVGVSNYIPHSSNKRYPMNKWIINDLGKRYRTSDGSYYKNVTKLIDNKYWAFDKDGYLYDGWFLLDGEWYYQTLDNGLKTGWHFENEDGKWYYLDVNTNKMLTDWQLIDNDWYYFNPYTPVQTWFYDNESESWFFDSDTTGRPLGSMFINERTPDGYFVNLDGEYLN